MKKLHGTHSIQPLTITDAVVAEDAQIAESKIALTYTTTELNDYASTIDQRLSAHEATSTDPHGQILTQTTIRSEDIQSAPSPVQQTITVSNAGDGNVLLEVDGDIKADNATLDGDVNISGVTSIGGQTHISGSVVIDGDLTVVGTTTKVESETIDYDSLLVTPSSATNHTGIIVAPDGTGFTGDTEPVTTIETVTVHDDVVHAPNGMKFLGTVGQDKDLLLFIAPGDGKWDTPRVVKTSYDGTEIKAKYEPGSILGETNAPVVTCGCVGSDGYIYLGCDIFTNASYVNSVIYKMSPDLEFIAASDPIALEVGGSPIDSPVSLRYMECYGGKLHLTVCDQDGNYCYVVSYPMSSSPDLDTFTALDLSEDFPEGATLFKVIPYSDGEGDHYVVYTDVLLYMIDASTGELEHEICDAYDDYGTCYVIDRSRGKLIEGYYNMVSEYSLDSLIEAYEDGWPDPEASSLYTDFEEDPEVNYWEYEADGLLGMTDANTVLYYSAPENKIYWLDIRNLIPFEDYVIDDEEEHTISLPDGYESDPVIITSRDSIVPEPPEPEVYDAALTSSMLSNFAPYVMTKDASGNIYCISSFSGAQDIVKINALTLGTQTIQASNENTSGSPEYTFGEAVYSIAVSNTGTYLYVMCDPYTPEDCTSLMFRFNASTGVCSSSDYVPFNGYSNGSWNGFWSSSVMTNPVTGDLVRISVEVPTEDPQFDVVVTNPDTMEVLKTIHITGTDYGCSFASAISPDGNYIYGIVEAEEPLIWKVPLNGGTSYDLDSSEGCISSTLYDAESYTVFGYPKALSITDGGRIFAAVAGGYIFEIDPDTLDITDSSGTIFSVASQNNCLNCLEATDNYVVLGCTEDNDGTLSNSFYAYDISDDTLISEAQKLTASYLAEHPIEVEEEPEEDIYDGVDIIRTVTRQIEVTTEGAGDTFLGNLLELQTRTRGLNEAAVIVDRNGNLNILKGDVTIQGNKLGVTSNGINFNSDITVPSVTTTDKGFIYKANSTATPGSTVISCKNSSNNNLFTVGGSGNASVGGTLTLGGASDPIYYDGNEYGTQADVAFTNNVVTFDDSILTLASGNNTPWKIFNAHSSVSLYFGVQNAPKLEISENEVTIAQTNTSLQNLAVHGTSSFTGDVTVALNATVDGVDIGIHDHSGVAGHGERIPATSVIGLQEFLDSHMETVQDYVGGMVGGNTESGIAVTYDDNSGKLNFDVNDFTITAAGNVSGSTTITNLGNSTFTMTVLDSDKVDGLHVTSGTVNNEANKVVKTDASGHTKCGWINTTSGNASTTTMDRVYASYDGYIRYYTPANFATQILALGGTVKNSHVHDKVNNLKPMRGSSTFNGTTGRVVMLPAAFANTNYTVAVTPTANTNGQLGDVWVSKSTDRFTVYNTGTATVAFDYIAIG